MKDVFIEEYERLLSEAEDRGLSPADAEAYAEARAYGAMTARVADMIDHARDMAKYDDRKAVIAAERRRGA